uniref:Uncharacterized protein n=1 Tax=Salix viminalis TaxID=40686 RepID=A0A6N2LY80_SALVM
MEGNLRMLHVKRILEIHHSSFYLMRTVQTSSTMSIGLLKKKRLFHRVGILKSLLVVVQVLRHLNLQVVIRGRSSSIQITKFLLQLYMMMLKSQRVQCQHLQEKLVNLVLQRVQIL